MSLNQHLTSSSAAHGRLAFHPDCPRCGHRLAGQLGADQLVGMRTQAALASAVLAFSAGAAPTAAIANQVVQQGEGTTDPVPEAPGLEPGFDPGGDDSFDGESAPAQGGEGGGQTDDGDGLPVESEPLHAPTPDQIDSETAPEVELPPPAQPPAPAPPVAEDPAPTPAPAPAAAPPLAAPAPPPGPEPQAEPQTLRSDKPDNEPERLKPDQRRPPASWPAPVAAPAPNSAPVIGEQAPAPANTTAAVVAVSQPAEPAPTPAPERRIVGASYRVQPGDSLWSIARQTLGTGATNGQLAREVARLWRLNEERIGTGDPSMLHVGTVLRLS